MALKALITEEDFNALPEPVQAEYTQGDDGRYQLDVEGVDGFALEDVGGLKKSLSTERSSRQKLEKQLKQFEDLDPEEARNALEALQNQPDQKTVEERAKELAEQRTQQFVKKHQQELSTREEQLQSMDKQMRKLLIDNQVNSALDEHGGDKAVLPYFIKQRVDMQKDDSGNYRTVVLNEDGNEEVDGRGDPVSVSDFIANLAKDQKYGAYFKGSGARGSGADGAGSDAGGDGRSGRTPKQIPSNDIETISRYRDQIAKGEVEVVDAA